MPKRTWSDLQSPEINPIQLDNNNLPVWEQKPVNPDDWMGTKDNNIYHTRKYANEGSKFLRGSGNAVYDEEEIKAVNQGTFNKYATGFASRALSIAPKVVQEGAHIAGALKYGTDWLFDRENADPSIIWDNAVVNKMNEFDEGLRETMKINKTYTERNGKLLDQMGGAGFWADDVFDSLAFLTSAFVIGGTTGAALKGVKGLFYTKKFMDSAAGVIAGRKLTTYGATVVNTVGEAGYETHDFNKMEREHLAYNMFERSYENLDLSQKQIVKEKVAPGSANVFVGNLATLLVPNYIQSHYMFGSAAKSASRLRRAVRDKALKASDVSIMAHIGKGVGIGVGSEGLWDEGVQHALQTYNQRREDFGLSFDDYITGLSARYMDNFATTDGQKNVVLGGIVGGIFGGFGGAGQASSMMQAIHGEENIYTRMLKFLDINDKFYHEHIVAPFTKFPFKRTEIDKEGNETEVEGEAYFDKNGDVQIDEDKVQRMFLSAVYDKFLWDEALIAAANADNMHKKAVDNDALAKLYYRYAHTPGMTDLDEVEKLMLSRDLKAPQELIDQGFAKVFTKEDLLPFREALEYAREKSMSAEDFTDSPRKQEFKSVVAKTLYAEHARRAMFQKMLATEELTDGQRESIQKLIDDSIQMTAELRKKSTLEKLSKAFNKEINTKHDIALKNQSLNDETIKNQAEFDRARYDVDEYHAINGKVDPHSAEFLHTIDKLYDNAPGTAAPFGTKFGYFEQLGKALLRKKRNEEDLEQALNSNGEIAPIISKIVTDIKNGVEYTTDEIEKLKKQSKRRGVSNKRMENKYQEAKVGLETNDPQIQQDVLTKFGLTNPINVPNPLHDPVKYAKDQAIVEGVDNRRKDQIAAEEDIASIGELNDIKKPTRDKRKRYREHQRDYGNIRITQGQNILDMFKTNDTFGDANTLNKVLHRLVTMRKVYQEAGRKTLLRTNQFKGFIEEIDRVIEELNDIKPEVERNFESRAETDRLSIINFSKALFNAIGIKINRESRSYDIINQEIYDAIAAVIGEDELKDILAEASAVAKEGFDFTFDLIYAEKIILEVKKKGHKDLLKIIKKQHGKIAAEFEKKFTALDVFSKKDPVGIHLKNSAMLMVQAYKKNPFKVFDNLMTFTFNRYASKTEKTSPIDVYMRDKDAIALLDKVVAGEDLVYEEVSREDLRSILEDHINLISLEAFTNRLKSTIDIAEIIDLESKVVRSEEHAPSNQQVIAIREAMFALHSAYISSKPYAGWLLLKGLAGTGKTKLISKMIPAMNSIISDSLVALSTHTNALKVLEDTLDGVSNTGLATEVSVDLLANEKTKMVLIDEVARLDSSELKELAGKIVQANKIRSENKLPALFIVTLGDPTQVMSANEQLSPIKGVLAGLINIQEIMPLTAIFRSANQSLVQAQQMFLDFGGKVNNLVTSVSSDLYTMADGIHMSRSSDDLIAQINMSKKENKDRTRAIIVGEKSQLQKYSRLGVEVFLPSEVGSLEFDEVYLDLDPRAFEFERKFNEAMYTTIARAKSYAFIKTYRDGWFHEVGEVGLEDITARDLEVRSNYSARLELESEVLRVELNERGFEEPQIISENDNVGKDIAEPQSEDDNAEEEEEDTSFNGGVTTGNLIPDDEKEKEKQGIWNIKFPTNDPVKGTKSIKPKVRAGSRAKFIAIWHKELGEHKVHIVGEHLNVDDTALDVPIWSEIGIVSEEEMASTSLGRAMTKKLKDLYDTDKNPLSNGLKLGKTGILDADQGPTVLAEGIVSGAQQLTYSYGKEINAEGVGFIGELKKKVIRLFKEKNIKFKVKIFRLNESNLIAGVPYLQIIRKDKKDQFIRLSGRRLRSTDQHSVRINKFYQAIRNIESLKIGKLGEEKFNELLKSFRRNFEVDSNNEIVLKSKKLYNYKKYQDEQKRRGLPKISKEQFEIISSFSIDFIPSFYKAGEVRQEVENEEDMNENYLTPAMKANKDTKYEFKKHPAVGDERGFVLMRSVRDPSKAEYLMTPGLEAGTGPAQRSLNILAKANPKSTFAHRIALTDTVDGKRVKRYVTTAKSLFAEDTTFGSYYLHLLALYEIAKNKAGEEGHEQLVRKHSDYLEDGNKRLTSEKNIERMEEVLLDYNNVLKNKISSISKKEFTAKKAETTTAPITTNDLENILGLNESGQQFYYPLLIGWVNKAGEDLVNNETQLEEVMGTKLIDIIGTNIQIKIDQKSIETIPEKRKTKKTKVGEGTEQLKDRIKNARRNKDNRNKNLTKAREADPGKEITIAEGKKLIRQFLPNLDVESDQVVRFVEQMIIDKIAKEPAWGTYKNEILYMVGRDGKTFEKPIRHEVMHKIITEYLTDEEREALFTAWIEENPTHRHKSVEEIEELIAERWHNHEYKGLTTKNYVLMRFFNFLSRVFGYMNRNMSDLDRFFATVEGGYFKTKRDTGIGMTKLMKQIINNYGTDSKSFAEALENYKAAKNKLHLETQTILRDGYSFVVSRENGVVKRKLFPVSRGELKDTVRREIRYGLIQDRGIIRQYSSPANQNEEWFQSIRENYANGELIIKNFNDLWNDIYENWAESRGEQINVEEKESVEEQIARYEAEEITKSENLSDHIINNDEKNQAEKISSLVKDFLSNIKYSNGVFMKWQEAFVRSLQLFHNLQPENENYIVEIEKQSKRRGSNPNDRIVVEHLKALFEIVNNPVKTESLAILPGTAKFTDENTFVYGEKEANEIYGPITADLAGVLKTQRFIGETNATFITRISNDSGIPVNNIIAYYNHHSSTMMWKAVVNVMGNQNKKEFFIVERIFEEDGTYSISYIPASTYGIATTLASELEEAFITKFPDETSLLEFINTWLNKYLVDYASAKDEFVRAFLVKLGLSSFVKALPDIDTDMLYNDIRGFFQRCKDDWGKKYTYKDEVGEDVEDIKDMTYFVSKDGGLIRKLSKELSSSSNYLRATNIKTGDGKKRYLWSPTSFMNTILNYMVMIGSKSSTKFNVNLPQYLQTKYFEKNPFINGKNTISRVINNDGLRKTARGNQKDFFSTYQNESPTDYFIRVFMAGFIDRLRRSKKDDVRYFQWSYPNERSQAVAAEVKVLNNDQIKEQIKDAIKQINEAEQYPNTKYSNPKRFINLRKLQQVLGKRVNITKKVLTEKQIDKYANDIIILLEKDAAEFTKLLIEKKVPIDMNMAKINNLLKFLPRGTDLSSMENGIKDNKKVIKSIKRENKKSEYLVTEEALLPIVELFVKNDYINSYFVNQLFLGDMNQFENEEDVMRRMSLASAPGSAGIVNKKWGMREKTKIMILGDSFKGIEDINRRLKKIFTGEEQDKIPALLEVFKQNLNPKSQDFANSDGAGWMLPERYEELKFAGFTEEYPIHKVLKPVIYSISDEGVSRGIKYASIVLTDQLVEQFPSLGVLRENMRRSETGEAIYISGVKVGEPNATVADENVFKEGYVADDLSSFEIFNRDYRIQLDPLSNINSKVSQPSQLIYLMKILDQNQYRAKRAYGHLSQIVELEGKRFFDRFSNPGTFRSNLLGILQGKGNERAHDAIEQGLSINFPAITDKIFTQLAAELSDSIVRIKFPGSKLVLQTESGIRKYKRFRQDTEGDEDFKLSYKLDHKKRLVAEVILPEGFLPKEYEDAIKEAVKNGTEAPDYFDLPDLLGFRIPSSDIHSGIVMKVVDFYSTPNLNVIIAPDLLVALHGSDFDVDSLFVIKRHLYPPKHAKAGQPVGYVKGKGGTWNFAKNFEEVKELGDLPSERSERIKYHKNGVIHELIDMMSSYENIEQMLGPIPMAPIKQAAENAAKLRSDDVILDLSNILHKIRAHEIIFSAASGTGIFGNSAKVLAYSLFAGPQVEDPETGKMKNTHPKLKDEANWITIDGVTHNQITVFDKEGVNLFTSIDGFINAAIDNIRELVLHKLNITGQTINGFIVLRAIGLTLDQSVNMLLQPAIMEYSKRRSAEAVKDMIQEKLGGIEYTTSMDEIELTTEEMKKQIKKNSDIASMPPASKGTTEMNDLIYQLRIIKEFEKATRVGKNMKRLADWLKIARILPVNKIEIEEVVTIGEEIFPAQQEGGDPVQSNYPFDMPHFFDVNPHLFSISNQVIRFQQWIKTVFLKYSNAIDKNVEEVMGMFDNFGDTRAEGLEIIRNEFLAYLMSNNIYNGVYKMDRDVVHRYMRNNKMQTLTGPKAVNQIFIRKVIELRKYLKKRGVSNKFLDHLTDVPNSFTRTSELRFDSGPHISQEEFMDFRVAFLELNKYDVEYNKKTRKYRVKILRGKKADNIYSPIQREFVSYGIMNWGLQFGASNYSVILPEDLYKEVDETFNDILKKFTEDPDSLNWNKVKLDYAIQLIINRGDLLGEVYFKRGTPQEKGQCQNEDGDWVARYSGKTDEYYYDREYANEENEEFPQIIASKSKFNNRISIYIRMNNPTDSLVHYQRIGSVNSFKHYNTSDKILKEGMTVATQFGGNIYNVYVDDLKKETFKYYGTDLKKGQTISFTMHHDVTRSDKVYKTIKSITGNEVTVVPAKESESIPAFSKGPVQTTTHTKGVQKVEKYTKEEVVKFLDVVISRKEGMQRRALEELRDKIVAQGLVLIREDLPGSALATFSPDGVIHIDINKMIGEVEDYQETIEDALTHEMFHGVTYINYMVDKVFKKKIHTILETKLNRNEKTGKLTFKNKNDLKKAIEIYNKRGFSAVTEDDIYGLTSAVEFLSEIFNDNVFSEAMDAIMETPLEKSLLRKIIDAIVGLFRKVESQSFSEYMLELVKKQTHRPNLIKVRKDIYRDGVGNEYNLKDVKFETIEAEKDTEETKTEDLARDNALKFSKQVQMDSAQYDVEMKDGKEGSNYIGKKDSFKYKRVTDRKTGMLVNFKSRINDLLKNFGEWQADLIWGDNIRHDEKIRTNEGNDETYDEYAERMELNLIYGEVKGNIVHLMAKRIFNKLHSLGFSDLEIQKEIENEASHAGGAIDADNYKWMNDPKNIKKIFKIAGINTLSNIVPDILKDFITLSEITVGWKPLGFAGTIDAINFLSNGRYSLIDWKTGRNFAKRGNTEAMKYGLQDVYITDNQREQAKLQLMWYAVLFKLNYPDVQFEDLIVAWIPDKWLIDKPDNEKYVEVKAYLSMIEAFVSDKPALEKAGIDPNIKAKMLKQSPKIFTLSEYTSRSNETLTKKLIDNNFDPQEEYRKNILEITAILSRHKQQRQIRVDELDKDELKRLADLYDQVAILRADPSMQLSPYPQQDIGIFTEWLGNYSDVNMGVFQTWVKIRDEQYNKYTMQHERELKHAELLLKPIYNDYMSGKLRIKRGGVDRFALVNYAELFSFAYKEDKRGGKPIDRLLTKKDKNEWSELTDAQKKYLTYMNSMFKKWFDEDGYLNQVATEMEGRTWTWLELYNKDKGEDNKMEYYDGWFPKIMKTQEEINYQVGVKSLGQKVGQGDVVGANLIGSFSKAAMDKKKIRALTWYVEDTFEGFEDTKMSLPIKYMDNPVVMSSQDYSKNLHFAFDGFNKSMLHKSHMDEVYSTGQALKVYLQFKKYGNGQPMFENTVRFLEKKLIGDIQNRSIKTKLSGKPITFGKKNISPDKIMMEMIRWTSATIMWLRPMQGGGNGLHAKLLTHREGLKGTFASTFAHIEGDAIDFQVKDNVFADKIYFGSFTKDAMFGDLYKNKTWLLARHLNYMPDNYDYATNRRFLLSTRNTPVNNTNMYMFHAKPEEYVSLTTMIAQLHYLKNPVDGKTLWDSYDVRKQADGTYDVEWVGETRGFEREGQGAFATDVPIKGLTTHEISKLKKVHERMQGGYRKEEAGNLEIYVMGKAIIQFKKYFPRLLMNAVGGKRQEVSLGAYRKLVDEKIDPETGKKLDVYEWVARVNEGRWTTVVNWMIASIKMSGNREYRWSQLETEQKQNVIDFMIGISMLGLFAGAYGFIFYNDDDDDTFKKWWRNYLILNLSQQYNPYELLHTMETMVRPVSFARAWKLAEGIRNMFVATGNLMIDKEGGTFNSIGQLKGWNEIMRSIPYLASWHDANVKFQNSDIPEEWWVEQREYKWK